MEMNFFFTSCGRSGLKFPDSTLFVTNQLGVCVCGLLVVVDVGGGKVLTGSLIVVIAVGLELVTIRRGVAVVELFARGSVDAVAVVGTNFDVAKKLELELSTRFSMAGFLPISGDGGRN